MGLIEETLTFEELLRVLVPLGLAWFFGVMGTLLYHIFKNLFTFLVALLFYAGAVLFTLSAEIRKRRGFSVEGLDTEDAGCHIVDDLQAWVEAPNYYTLNSVLFTRISMVKRMGFLS